MDEDDVVVSTVATAAMLGAGLLARRLIGAAWARRRGRISWRIAITTSPDTRHLIGARG